MDESDEGLADGGKLRVVDEDLRGDVGQPVDGGDGVGGPVLQVYGGVDDHGGLLAGGNDPEVVGGGGEDGVPDDIERPDIGEGPGAVHVDVDRGGVGGRVCHSHRNAGGADGDESGHEQEGSFHVVVCVR